MCCFEIVACGLVPTKEVVVCRLNTRIMALLVNLYIYVLSDSILRIYHVDQFTERSIFGIRSKICKLSKR